VAQQSHGAVGVYSQHIYSMPSNSINVSKKKKEAVWLQLKFNNGDSIGSGGLTRQQKEFPTPIHGATNRCIIMMTVISICHSQR
jgi:hypothetical protein